MSNKRPMNKLAPEEPKNGRRRYRGLVISGIVVGAILLLFVGAFLWNAGPAKTKAFKPVNQAVNEVMPWQFGTVLYDQSMGPLSDQPAERRFYIRADGNPETINASVTKAIEDAGFSGVGATAKTLWWGKWHGNENGQFVEVSDVIVWPGDSFINPDGSKTHIENGQTGIIIKIYNN